MHCITMDGGWGPHQHQYDWTEHLLWATSSPPPLSLSMYLSLTHVSLTPTGRVVLMANPQQWFGVVWGRGKALTSVTFSTARYKSVTPEKTGTWIRQGAGRPVIRKTYVACLCVCLTGRSLSYVWHACWCSDSRTFFFALLVIHHTLVASVIWDNQYRC